MKPIKIKKFDFGTVGPLLDILSQPEVVVVKPNDNSSRVKVGLDLIKEVGECDTKMSKSHQNRRPSQYSKASKGGGQHTEEDSVQEKVPLITGTYKPRFKVKKPRSKYGRDDTVVRGSSKTIESQPRVRSKYQRSDKMNKTVTYDGGTGYSEH